MSVSIPIAAALCLSVALPVPAARADDDRVPILDLDAGSGVATKPGSAEVTHWNDVSGARQFVTGRPDSAPLLKKDIDAIRGHDAIVFRRQELVCPDEDAFDHLITGSGYTWFAVLSPYEQIPGLKDVNSFFGNLRNGGNYEGLWGNFNDDGSVWIGTRNGVSFGRFDENNPKVQGPRIEIGRYHIVAGRMAAGTDRAAVELFVNAPSPVASASVPINPTADASKLAIGQERDAVEHPGKESFDGELTRFVLYDLPLRDDELATVISGLAADYGIDTAED